MKSQSELTSYLNKIHLGETPEFLKPLHENIIGLTITSPPYYDSDLYILDNDTLEFGWKTYDDYLKHLESNIKEILRITVEAGKLILVLSNTPETDDDGNVIKYWPLNHDLSTIARKAGWELVDEVIWVKSDKTNYSYLKTKKAPESTLLSNHDTISVFRKPGPDREGSEMYKYPSVWEMQLAGPVKKYNIMYPSFPDELVERCIKLWSLPNDIVLDPYAGSGQVGRVANRMNRLFIGVEIDKQWAPLWNDINL